MNKVYKTDNGLTVQVSGIVDNNHMLGNAEEISESITDETLAYNQRRQENADAQAVREAQEQVSAS